MCEVNIKIGATASKYWAVLHCQCGTGASYKKCIEGERNGSLQSNHLQAAIVAFQALLRPCVVNVYTQSEYVTEAFRQGWLNNWEKSGWRNAKGNIVRNVDQWKELRAAMAPHSARFLYPEREKH